MAYSTGGHTTFRHRDHLVWAPKYRFKVLRGEVRLRVREIIRQVCAEMGGTANITDDIIMRYLDRHIHKNGFGPAA